MWQSLLNFLHTTHLAMLLGVIVIGLALSLAEYFISYRMIPHFEEKHQHWRLAFARAFHYPAQLLIWIFVIYHVLNTLFLLDGSPNTIHAMREQVSTGRKVILQLDLLWFLMRFISEVEAFYSALPSSHRFAVKDKTKVAAFSQLTRVLVIVFILLALLPTVGISISGLLTFGGVTGVVLGFAAKDTLANFFGGMMIYFDRPFSVGDWVRVPGGHVEGTVEAIGWRLTRIRTFSKNLLYVPNGTFSSVSIENPSRMSHRRIKTKIGLRYQDLPVMEKVLRSIEDMLRNHSGIDARQTLFVKFSEYGESSVNMTVYTFTNTVNWIEFESIREDVYFQIAKIVHAHGADFAFPSRSLYIEGGPAEKLSHAEADTVL